MYVFYMRFNFNILLLLLTAVSIILQYITYYVHLKHFFKVNKRTNLQCITLHTFYTSSWFGLVINEWNSNMFVNDFQN